MVIGIDASRANRLDRTGVEWYAFRLLQALKTVAPNTPITLYSPTPPLEDFGTLPNRWQWKVLRHPIRRGWSTIALHRELSRHPPSVFFTPAYGFLRPLPQTLPTTVTIHDLGFYTHPDCYSVWDRMFQRLVLSSTVERVSRLIVPSQATSSDLRRWYPNLPPQKIAVIPHGMDHTLTRPSNERPLASFLFTGRIERKKNIIPMLQALEQLAHERGFPDLHVTLVGRSGYGFREIQPLLRSCPDHITWLGSQPEETLKRLRASARFMLLPSAVEGFGLPVLEAWENAMIPIITNIPALEEVGGDGAYYLLHNHPGLWTSQIDELLRRRATQQELIERSRKRSQKFNWIHTAKATLDVLTSCL